MLPQSKMVKYTPQLVKNNLPQNKMRKNTYLIGQMVIHFPQIHFPQK